MIEMVHARVGFAVCVERGSDPCYRAVLPHRAHRRCAAQCRARGRAWGWAHPPMVHSPGFTSTVHKNNPPAAVSSRLLPTRPTPNPRRSVYLSRGGGVRWLLQTMAAQTHPHTEKHLHTHDSRHSHKASQSGHPSPPPVSAHRAPERARHAERAPPRPHTHACARHTEPVPLPWVPFHFLPLRCIQSSRVTAVRSPPVHPGARDTSSPCARDPARVTPRAPAHAHPARSRHTSDPHPTPNTSLVQLESQEESRDAGGIDVEPAEWAHQHPRDTNVAKHMATAQHAVHPVGITPLAGGDGGSLLRRLELVDGRDRLHQGFAELVQLRLGQGGELARGAPGAQPAGVLGDGSSLLCNAPTCHGRLWCRVGVVRLVVGCPKGLVRCRRLRCLLCRRPSRRLRRRPSRRLRRRPSRRPSRRLRRARTRSIARARARGRVNPANAARSLAFAVVRIGRILTGRLREIPGLVARLGSQGHNERSRALRASGIGHGDLRNFNI